MSLSEKAYKGVAWSIIQFLGAQISTTVVLLILARILGAEAFGLIALASVYIDFVQILVEQGFAVAIMQRQDLEPEHLDTAFWIAVGLSLLLAAVTVIFAGPIANLFQEQQLKQIIQWLSLIFIFRSLGSVQEALLKRELNFKGLAVRTLGGNFAASIVGLTMAFQGFGAWSLVGRQLTEVIIGTILLWSLEKWRPGFDVTIRHFRDLFSYGINILGDQMAVFFSRRSDDFLIGYFLGPVYLGYYTVAYRFIEISVRLITMSLGQVVIPTFSKIQDNLSKVRRGFYKVTEMTTYVSASFFFALALLAPEIINSLLGENWESSILILRLLSFYGIIQAILMFNGEIMNSMGKPNWNFSINTFFAVINVIAFVLVVPWGINAIAAVYVARGYLLSPISLLAVKKLIKINFRDYRNAFVKPLALGILVSLSILAAKGSISIFGSDLLVIFASTIMSVVIFLLFLAKFSPEFINEAKKIISKKGVSSNV